MPPLITHTAPKGRGYINTFNDTMKWRFWLLGNATCSNHVLFFFFLYICIQIPNFFLAYLIITKKNHYENIKKPLEASFNYFFASKNILVISLFFFAIVIQILNCLLTKLIITKKLLWKYKKPLKAFFFLPKAFWLFHCAFEMQKDLFSLD